MHVITLQVPPAAPHIYNRYELQNDTCRFTEVGSQWREFFCRLEICSGRCDFFISNSLSTAVPGDYTARNDCVAGASYYTQHCAMQKVKPRVLVILSGRVAADQLALSLSNLSPCH